MNCKYCKTRLVGTEATYGLCIDCQIAKEDAENLNELNRYREMFPIPPWSNDPITPEVCERLGVTLKEKYGTCIRYVFKEMIVDIPNSDSDDPWSNSLAYIGGTSAEINAGQLACLVAARKTDAKH